MTLPGKLIEAPEGLRGFDANQHISQSVAQAFRNAGHRFCLRYVPRHDDNPGDITQSEAHGIMSAGLGLMIVQHVKSPPWVPNGNMGAQYGANAARVSTNIGYLPGGMIWCDLEGVDLHTDHRDVISFCNNWLDQVGHAGFTPGLYVGFDPGLTADELYSRLRFEHYWSAYNLNRDQFPATRGVQMKQGIERVFSGVRYDPDTIQRDALGGLPLMAVDMEWSA